MKNSNIMNRYMFMRVVCFIIPIFVLSLGLVACNSNKKPENIEISVNPSSVVVKLGEKINLTAIVTGTKQKHVTWNASKGKIIGEGNTIVYSPPLQAGQYKVTAISGADINKKAIATIRVNETDQPKRNTSVVIKPKSFVILKKKGDEHKLQGAVYGENGRKIEGAKINWVSTNPSIASVSSEGVVRAESDFGSSQIVAEYKLGNKVFRSSFLSVSVAKLMPNSVMISDSEIMGATLEDAEAEIVNLVFGKNAKTGKFKVNDVLVGDASVGLIVKILSISNKNGMLHVRAKRAVAKDAYERISVESSIGMDKKAFLNDAQLRAQSESIIINDDSIIIKGLQSQKSERLECEQESGAHANVDVELSAFDIKMNKNEGRLIHFKAENLGHSSNNKKIELGVHKDFQIEFTAGKAEAKVKGGFEGSIECKYKMLQIPIAITPLPLGFAVSGEVDISALVKIEAKGGIASVKKIVISGPKISFDHKIDSGIKWTNASGAQPLSVYNRSSSPSYGLEGPSIDFPNSDEDFESEDLLKLYIDAGVELGTSVELFARFSWGLYGKFRKELIGLNIVEMQFTLGGVLKFISNTSDPIIGPKRQLCFEGNIKVGLAGELPKKFDYILGKLFKVSVSNNMLENLTTFEYNTKFIDFSSDNEDLLSNLKLSKNSIEVGEKINISLHASHKATGILKKDFYATKVNFYVDGKKIGTVGQGENKGDFSLEYVPSKKDIGRKKVQVLAYYFGLPVIGKEAETLFVKEKANAAKVCKGSFVIDNVDTEGDLEKIKNCKEITGGLRIQKTNLKNLDSLKNLTKIGGNLLVGGHLKGNPNLISLEGLKNLTTVGWTLRVSYNDSLISLEGLKNLTKIGGYLIIGGDSLKDVDGLNNLTTIGRDLSVGGNLTNIDGLNNLTTIGRDLSVGGNLTNIDGLKSLTTVGGYLSISSHSLISVDGLKNLTTIGEGLDISSNSLMNIDGLSSLTTIGGSVVNKSLRISGNSLKDVDGLRNLTTIGGSLDIHGDSLINIDGLRNLTTIGGSLDIHGDSLINIDGLRNLTIICRSFIEDNNKAIDCGGLGIGGDSLINIDGLRNLTAVDGHLTVSDSENLINLDGLSSITAINGDLNIIHNSSLINLDSLANIAIINGDLNITQNTSLINLDGLKSPATVGGDLFIYDNKNLTNLEGLRNIKKVGGYRNISNNPKLDCTPYNSNPFAFFPLDNSIRNKVNCTTK